MDFMNLNQAAHGDREAGFLHTRLRLARKVIVGHWSDTEVQQRLGAWVRVVSAWHDWQGARFCRFGDNMREVSVTEGNKVSAEAKFGFAVNGYGVGDLVQVINGISDVEVDAQAAEYERAVPAMRLYATAHVRNWVSKPSLRAVDSKASRQHLKTSMVSISSPALLRRG